MGMGVCLCWCKSTCGAVVLIWCALLPLLRAQIVATVSGALPRSTYLNITVNVTDANDAPACPGSPQLLSVVENSEPGTALVPSVQSTDPDGPGSKVYAILRGNDYGYFR